MMDSIPSAANTNWIQKTNGGSSTKQEFYFDKNINKCEFKMQFNCSNSCWRSMVTADEEILLATRYYKDNKLVNQVKSVYLSFLSNYSL